VHRLRVAIDRSRGVAGPVNFLVDNQLPAALSRFLSSRGHVSQHVLDISMDEAGDLPLWEFAKAHELIVVSKDEDFFHLVHRPGETGRLLWVRLGNCRNEPLLATFETQLPDVERAFASGQRVVELR
jgi:predicted nuclease of predicted toxin-antitoxin system